MGELPLYRQAVSRSGGIATVVLSGELDLANRDDIHATLLAELTDPATTTVGLDLAAVGFVDSSALSVLVAAYQSAREAGKVFVVTAASAQVTRVLQLTGLDELLTETNIIE
jgi:anti-sigma B factor antagonist